MFTFENPTPNDSFNPLRTLREAFTASNLSWDDFEATMCDSLDELYAEEEAKKNSPVAACGEDPATLTWEDLFDSIIRPWCIANLPNGSIISTLDSDDYAAYRKECLSYLREALDAYVQAKDMMEKLKTTKLTKEDISNAIKILFS